MKIQTRAGVPMKFDKYVLDPEKTCEKNDCIYRSAKEFLSQQAGSCSYIFLTGRSRIAQLPEGEARWPSNCPFYVKKEKGKKAET